MGLSIREQALSNMTGLFAGMDAAMPLADPYGVQFDYVRRNPLDEDSWKKRLTLGVHDTNEIVEQKISIAMRQLQVVLEFRCTLQTGEVASTVGNAVIGAIQRRVWEDKTLGGTVIDVVETQNETYIDDFDHRQLSGAVFLKIIYRTRDSDPRRQT